MLGRNATEGARGSKPPTGKNLNKPKSTRRLWPLAGGAFLLLAVVCRWPLPFIAIATITQAALVAYLVYRLRGVDLYKLYVDWFTAARERIDEDEDRPWGH